MATIDVIWLFSMLMEPLSTTLWLPTTLHSTPMEVLVVEMQQYIDISPYRDTLSE